MAGGLQKCAAVLEKQKQLNVNWPKPEDGCGLCDRTSFEKEVLNTLEDYSFRIRWLAVSEKSEHM